MTNFYCSKSHKTAATLKHQQQFFLTTIYLIMTIAFLLVGTGLYAKTQKPKNAANLVADNQVIDLTSDRYQQLFSELEEKHYFTRSQLMQLFKGLRINRTVLQLMDKQWEAKPYYKYRALFITPITIIRGKKNLVKYRPLLDRIEEQYGVDREIIVAIWGIESRFGSQQGNFSLLRTLNTLFDAYPRRSNFFRRELINFLILCKANGIDPQSVKGSYAGAFGQAQFMPSSFNAYAVDFDGDNRRDLINSKADIFASIANYLHRFGWTLGGTVYEEIGNILKSERLKNIQKAGRKGRIDWQFIVNSQKVNIARPAHNRKLSIIGLQQSPQHGGKNRYVAAYPNFRTVTKYNHSNKYAMAVAELAEAFKK